MVFVSAKVDWLAMPLEFTRPWLLLTLLPLMATVVWYFLRSLSDFPRPQRIVSLSVRLVILVLLVCSLAGLTWLREAHEQFVIFLRDESLSIGQNGSETAGRFLQQAAEERGTHRAVVLPFAKTAGTVTELSTEMLSTSVRLPGA